MGRLYIRYQLDGAEGEDPLIELQDVRCLLRDEKELNIQKDFLNDKLEICRSVCDLNRWFFLNSAPTNQRVRPGDVKTSESQ